MTRRDDQRLHDIAAAAQRCLSYRPLLDSPDPVVAEAAYDAVLYGFVVVGEAAAHLTQGTTDALPDVPWPRVRGLRNVLAHQYFRVERHRVEDVLENHLEPLVRAVNEHGFGAQPKRAEGDDPTDVC